MNIDITKLAIEQRTTKFQFIWDDTIFFAKVTVTQDNVKREIKGYRVVLMQANKHGLVAKHQQDIQNIPVAKFTSLGYHVAISQVLRKAFPNKDVPDVHELNFRSQNFA